MRTRISGTVAGLLLLCAVVLGVLTGLLLRRWTVARPWSRPSPLAVVAMPPRPPPRWGREILHSVCVLRL